MAGTASLFDVDAGRGHLVRRRAGGTGAQGRSDAKPATAQAKDTAPADYVGAETCATCHEEVVKGFANNPHTKMALMHGENGVTCENCHGAGKAHVEGGGDITKIFDPAKASAKEVDAKCLGCHAGSASQLRSFASRQGRGKLHQLPQRSQEQATRSTC